MRRGEERREEERGGERFDLTCVPIVQNKTKKLPKPTISFLGYFCLSAEVNCCSWATGTRSRICCGKAMSKRSILDLAQRNTSLNRLYKVRERQRQRQRQTEREKRERQRQRDRDRGRDRQREENGESHL
jgi:hypothetical protein